MKNCRPTAPCASIASSPPSPAPAPPPAAAPGALSGVSGLTSAEVAEREAAGLTNEQSKDTSRSLAEILRGPAHGSDGRTNLAGALRRAMATCGYPTLKELQKAELTITPVHP